MTERTRYLPPLPARPADAHKGSFGTVIVFGGSTEMIGAPALAATAAFRSGTGLVKIAAPGNVLPYILTVQPSATGLTMPINYNSNETLDAFAALNETLHNDAVLAAGPGMGTGVGQQRLVQMILRQVRPVVLDADGLNNLATLGDGRRAVRCPLVITPHPGEYRRLAQQVGLRTDPVAPESRVEAAEALAKAYGATVVLKGAATVVANEQQHFVNDTGNPALATAGTGDVLTGVIASLIAQGMSLFEAACLGVHLHGLAADLWVRRHSPAGMLAMDVANWVAHAVAELAPPRDDMPDDPA